MALRAIILSFLEANLYLYKIEWSSGFAGPLRRKLKENLLRDLCVSSGAGCEYNYTPGFCSIREKPYGKQKLVSRARGCYAGNVNVRFD